MGSEAYLEAHTQKHGSTDSDDYDDDDDDKEDQLLFNAASHMTGKRSAGSSSEREAAVG